MARGARAGAAGLALLLLHGSLRAASACEAWCTYYSTDVQCTMLSLCSDCTTCPTATPTAGATVTTTTLTTVTATTATATTATTATVTTTTLPGPTATTTTVTASTSTITTTTTPACQDFCSFYSVGIRCASGMSSVCGGCSACR
mmetsp:Transcript_111608/g.296628  ORF Transcript_111608/g.296628 Transcript_111608/m.296628 type:complete len:145 (-) Transcript_111608:95-529(-)